MASLRPSLSARSAYSPSPVRLLFDHSVLPDFSSTISMLIVILNFRRAETVWAGLALNDTGSAASYATIGPRTIASARPCGASPAPSLFCSPDRLGSDNSLCTPRGAGWLSKGTTALLLVARGGAPLE